ncbi:hypothetical protein ACFX10_027759 [Malus domestica]
MLVVEALASGYILALSSTIITNLTHCLAETTVNKIDPHQTGQFWVLQLWLQVYFATLRPEAPNSNPLKR